ncbi:unnamed protein product [Heligmosomoides polygyrus]|uniref:Helitron_like_N domain-containing protein n=1 Tax=Heligmosomoides polygyrus TaxID=6339 RepID=A0A183GTL6_HELPZ|nr:unnamed protein product [Heligmosomoides polygyrus]
MFRGVRMDNRSVVPYSPYLTRMFEAHINVEVCALIHAVKYLFKYVYKGPDRARVHIYESSDGNQRNQDEIDAYIDARYVCAPEAVHRIFEFKMQDRSDAVERLQAHLPGYESVIFNAGEEEQALEAAQNRLSTLTGYFAINKTCTDLEQHGRLPVGMVDSRDSSSTKAGSKGNARHVQLDGCISWDRKSRNDSLSGFSFCMVKDSRRLGTYAQLKDTFILLLCWLQEPLDI